MVEIGQYAIERTGWICQRCGRFSIADKPQFKGCLEKENHIYYMGSREVRVVPKEKLKDLLRMLKAK